MGEREEPSWTAHPLTACTLVILETPRYVHALLSSIALEPGASPCAVAPFLVSRIFGGSQGLAGSATSGFHSLTDGRGVFSSAL